MLTLKSSNCLGFNPILQKFYEMICEILVSKIMSEIFFIFYHSCFTNNFIVNSKFRNHKITKRENISKPIYLKNFPHIVIFCTKKYTFFQMWLFHFNIIFITYFKNHLEKLNKNGDFTLLIKSLKSGKLSWPISGIQSFSIPPDNIWCFRGDRTGTLGWNGLITLLLLLLLLLLYYYYYYYYCYYYY